MGFGFPGILCFCREAAQRVGAPHPRGAACWPGTPSHREAAKSVPYTLPTRRAAACFVGLANFYEVLIKEEAQNEKVIINDSITFNPAVAYIS